MSKNYYLFEISFLQLPSSLVVINFVVVESEKGYDEDDIEEEEREGEITRRIYIPNKMCKMYEFTVDFTTVDLLNIKYVRSRFEKITKYRQFLMG